MAKQRAAVFVMLLAIMIAVCCRMVIAYSENTSAEECGKPVRVDSLPEQTLFENEVQQLCREILNRLLLLAVTVPFLITSLLLTRTAMLIE